MKQSKHERRLLEGVLPYLREKLPTDVAEPLRQVEKCYRCHSTRVNLARDSFTQLVDRPCRPNRAASKEALNVLFDMRMAKTHFDTLQSTAVVSMQVEVEIALYLLRKHCSYAEWLENNQFGFSIQLADAGHGKWRSGCTHWSIGRLCSSPSQSDDDTIIA